MKHIPNLITCLNLFAGSLACVMALKFENYTGAFFFIALAALFDFLDGLAARALHAWSPMGVELDSLADVVSFGLAPGCVVYSYFDSYSSTSGLPLVAFLLPIFAALRLAKFNTDARQRASFLGLPVPASGLFWASFIPSIHWIAIFPMTAILPCVVLLLVLFCVLMVSELPMFSLKFKNLKWEDNRWQFSFVAASLLVLVAFVALRMALLGVSVVVLLYIILSAARAIQLKRCSR
jgi:CDP-diacylglycerol--serine O-phosphatidyltransferase